MTRIKQLRQVAAQQLHGQGQPAGRRLDALDEEQALTPAEAASVDELRHGLLQKVKAWLRGEA